MDLITSVENQAANLSETITNTLMSLFAIRMGMADECPNCQSSWGACDKHVALFDQVRAAEDTVRRAGQMRGNEGRK